MHLYLRRLASLAARRASMSSFDDCKPAAWAAADGPDVISRNLFVQNLHCASVPFSTLAPKMACMSSSCSGFMMADVMPWLAAMARK